MNHTIFECVGRNGRAFMVKGFQNKVKMLNTWKRRDGTLGSASVLLFEEDVDELICALVDWKARKEKRDREEGMSE